ncbi:MAG: hypothetical protein MO847_03850 [Candidatus Protistobacter heckmanni]|nr:hypothetical protein [Candidatus Protistobacter heckmanni]
MRLAAAWALALPLALGACSILRGNGADAQIRAALADYERYRAMNAVELNRELTLIGAQAAYAVQIQTQPPGQVPAPLAAQIEDAADRGPALQLRQALLLSLHRNPADTARALAVVEELRRSPAPRAVELRALTNLLAALGREEQRRADQLAEKLEALRAIERKLLSRPDKQGTRNGRGEER